MASITLMVGGATFKAMAFTGGNYFHTKANTNIAAIEQYTKEESEYNFEGTKNQDWLKTEIVYSIIYHTQHIYHTP